MSEHEFDKQMLVNALENARELYREYITGASSSNAAAYLDGISELIIASFRIPLGGESERLVRKTITESNYVKGAVERLEVLTHEHNQAEVSRKLNDVKDLAAHVSTHAFSALDHFHRRDSAGARAVLTAVQQELGRLTLQVANLVEKLS